MNAKILLFVCAVSMVAFLYRIYGIFDTHPFWVDEFSTAINSLLILKYGLSVFTNPAVNLEIHNITTHFLVASFFKVLGHKEWVARLPFVIIGSVVPLMVFLVARKLYNLPTAVCAMLLTTFSYFEITWSRQARAYVLIQFLILAADFLYLQLQEKSNHTRIYQALFVLTVLLGVLTHAFFLIFLIALCLYILFFQRSMLLPLLKKPLTYIVSIIGLAVAIKTGLASQIIGEFVLSNPIKANNLWYYHSFLWREYGLISFLAIMGFGIGLTALQKRKPINLVLIYTILYLLFLCYFFTPYVSRYLLPIFPFLLISMSYSIVQLVSLINLPASYNRIKIFLPLLIVVFIIGNGDTFANKPKRFYSVNHDFREIALIDYHQVYDIIKKKGQIAKGQTAVIDTWHDRLFWYMGMDYKPAYTFRWIEEPGLVNGLKKRTSFEYNSEGEKIIPRKANVKFIGELSDLKRALKKYPKGFIFIDDSSLPKEVIEYAKMHFKKELYLDHYPLDDNPYSIWPATLYSWGV